MSFEDKEIADAKTRRPEKHRVAMILQGALQERKEVCVGKREKGSRGLD